MTEPRLTRFQEEEQWVGGAPNATRARAYQTMLQVWHSTKDFFPDATTMPTPMFQRKPEGRGAAGMWQDQDGRLRGVALDTDHLAALAAPSADRLSRNSALATLLHEWAHNHQNKAYLSPEQRVMYEGAATAFALLVGEQVAKRLGWRGFRVPMGTFPPEYVEAARKLMSEKGKDFVLRGQFTAPQEPGQ